MLLAPAAWLSVLAAYDDQDTGEALGRDEVFADLSARPGWPQVPVTFVAHEAYTGWGEVVKVRGDLPALGAWGTHHLGVALATTAADYPTWRSEPLPLPLGARFAWKLVASPPGPGPVRWESGGDRVGTAAFGALVPGDEVLLSGTWR